MTDISSTMQLEAAEGEAYRRELAAKRVMRKDDAVPVSSLQQRIYKAPPMHVQVAKALAERQFSPHDRQYLEKLATIPRGLRT